MDSGHPPDVTRLLQAWAAGDEQALLLVTPMVYDELRRLAQRYARSRGASTLQTTALAHEAYIRLVKADNLQWQDRAHFFAVAAQMMRRILVDAARAKASAKRSDGSVRVEFSEALPVSRGRAAHVLELDDALEALARLDPRKARVVELRYFVGLSVGEVAAVLAVSPETVRRDWRIAKPWLARQIGQSERHDA
jgi:RNA polymerase sigma-70 factor, ECF subfamily